MKKYCFLTLLLTAAGSSATACTLCNRQVREGIYNSRFYPNLIAMMSAFIVLGIAVAALSFLSTRITQKGGALLAAEPQLSTVPLTTASVVIGMGLGGFIDGIVFHQLLQWHEMLSNKIPATDYVGKSINMFWDGVFHAFCFMVVLTGVLLLWRLLQRKDVDTSGRLLAGGLLLGWGLFNLVEGIIDHHLLKLHNVKELSANPQVANYSFLALGLLLLLAGYGLVKARHNGSRLLPTGSADRE